MECVFEFHHQWEPKAGLFLFGLTVIRRVCEIANLTSVQHSKWYFLEWGLWVLCDLTIMAFGVFLSLRGE